MLVHQTRQVQVSCVVVGLFHILFRCNRVLHQVGVWTQDLVRVGLKDGLVALLPVNSVLVHVSALDVGQKAVVVLWLQNQLLLGQESSQVGVGVLGLKWFLGILLGLFVVLVVVDCVVLLVSVVSTGAWVPLAGLLDLLVALGLVESSFVVVIGTVVLYHLVAPLQKLLLLDQGLLVHFVGAMGQHLDALGVLRIQKLQLHLASLVGILARVRVDRAVRLVPAFKVVHVSLALLHR